MDIISADTSQSLTFKDLVSAWERITHPTEVEEVPLSFDPDDYPVALKGLIAMNQFRDGMQKIQSSAGHSQEEFDVIRQAWLDIVKEQAE